MPASTRGLITAILFLQVHQEQPQTNCSTCWMLLRVLSVETGSSTVVSVSCCTTSSTGSTSLIEFSARSDSSPVSERPCTIVPVGSHCTPLSAGTRRHLRSTNRNLLAVPHYRLNTYGGRAFAVAGPTSWNSLPDFIRDPSISTDSFRRLLKTYLFARY